jgi:ankyrin repeat protein
MAHEKFLIAVFGILFLVVVPVCGEEIHNAVKEGDIARVESLLVKKPEKINAKEKDDLTPLHYAAMHGHKDVSELLIGKGANVNAKTKLGFTPLHYAKNKDISALLISKGADVNAKTKLDFTPLHYAAMYAHEDVAEILRSHGGE